MPAAATTQQVLVANSTYRFRLTARKDGAVWDLTDAAVYLILRRGFGEPASVQKTATVESAAGGTAYYDCTVDDLDGGPGEARWRRQWRVVQGSLDLRSRPVEFTVVS